MILRSSLLVVFLVALDPVFRTWVPSRVRCSQQFLTAHSERSTWPATRRVDQPAVFTPMIRPLSNSLNCEKCLLARLPGMFLLPKSSYNRQYYEPTNQITQRQQIFREWLQRLIEKHVTKCTSHVVERMKNATVLLSSRSQHGPPATAMKDGREQDVTAAFI
ncbi:uncharacterized protein TNCV_2297101 [Trichonephila clavipes]|nr:uncharacterized protein TNCV_2297101 [Trichonephila clavipes]